MEIPHPHPQRTIKTRETEEPEEFWGHHQEFMNSWHHPQLSVFDSDPKQPTELMTTKLNMDHRPHPRPHCETHPNRTAKALEMQMTPRPRSVGFAAQARRVDRPPEQKCRYSPQGLNKTRCCVTQHSKCPAPKPKLHGTGSTRDAASNGHAARKGSLRMVRFPRGQRL